MNAVDFSKVSIRQSFISTVHVPCPNMPRKRSLIRISNLNITNNLRYCFFGSVWAVSRCSLRLFSWFYIRFLAFSSGGLLPFWFAFLLLFSWSLSIHLLRHRGFSRSLLLCWSGVPNLSCCISCFTELWFVSLLILPWSLPLLFIAFGLFIRVWLYLTLTIDHLSFLRFLLWLALLLRLFNGNVQNLFELCTDLSRIIDKLARSLKFLIY